jgi:lipooligosaccharide transport system permease protein
MTLLTQPVVTRIAADRRIGATPIMRRHAYASRRMWIELIAAVVEPLMYLLAIGVGLGKMVGHAPGMPSVSYAAYVAPGLLAMATMNASTAESIFGAFERLRQARLFDSVLTTPITVTEIARSEFWLATTRGTLAGVGFLGVMGATGLLSSWTALLVIPSCVLIALAFATAGLIVGSLARDYTDFQWVQLVMLPMFLFATTFYPITVYPAPIQALVRVLPLYQSINVVRGPALGRIDSGYVVGLVYLAVMAAVCAWFAIRRMHRVLVH